MNQEHEQVMQKEPVDRTNLMRLVPRWKPDVPGLTLDGETMLLDLSTGHSYRLNSVWTAVWEQCDGSATLFDIQAVLRSPCELSPEHAHDEVVSVVLQMEHDGLLSQIRTWYGSRSSMTGPRTSPWWSNDTRGLCFSTGIRVGFGDTR